MRPPLHPAQFCCCGGGGFQGLRLYRLGGIALVRQIHHMFSPARPSQPNSTTAAGHPTAHYSSCCTSDNVPQYHRRGMGWSSSFITPPLLVPHVIMVLLHTLTAHLSPTQSALVTTWVAVPWEKPVPNLVQPGSAHVHAGGGVGAALSMGPALGGGRPQTVQLSGHLHGARRCWDCIPSSASPSCWSD